MPEATSTPFDPAALKQRIDAEARALGFDAVGSTPAEFEARIKSEIAKWAKVIRAAGMAPQ